MSKSVYIQIHDDVKESYLNKNQWSIDDYLSESESGRAVKRTAGNQL